MSKEYLEALMTFNYIMTRCEDEDSYIIKFPLGIQEGTTFGEDMQKAYKVIKEALERLEAIDNANPNEALEKLEETNKIIHNYISNGDYDNTIVPNLDTIKQALLKAQEQEKNFLKREMQLLYNKNFLKEENAEYKRVLEIIKAKNVNVELLKDCENRYEYNTHFPYLGAYQLNQEEFELLKEHLK